MSPLVIAGIAFVVGFYFGMIVLAICACGRN